MTRSLYVLTMLSVALLVGCAAPVTPGASADRPGQVAQRWDYVVNVPLETGDTPVSLSKSLGGTVLSWNDSQCAQAGGEACEALLGMNTGQTLSAQTLNAQTLSALGAGRNVYIEPNRDVFSGGGTVTATFSGSLGLWAGGSLGLWAGGSLGLWAGGSYSPLPQNTQVWSKINLQAAHKLASNLGAGVTVAVIDTGLDLNHPAFQGSLTDPVTWQDFYANDAVPQDEGTLGMGAYGHGTNVAGIVLQVAPRAKIMPLRVLGPDGSGDVATVARAIDWAVSKGANIINLSLGSSDNSKVVQDAVKRATLRNILVMSSAGNANVNKITYPAASASEKDSGINILSVGSVDLADQKSSFSNYSDRLKVMAPGENVYAPAPGGRIAAWSGTSQATPMAAGGLALALGQTLKVPVGDLTSVLAQAAFDIYDVPGNAAYDKKLGIKGRLDLAAFLSAAVN